MKITNQLKKQTSFFLNFFIMMILFFAVIAPISGQNTKNNNLSLNVQNRPLSEVFQQISALTDYKFFYDQDIVDKAPSITLNVRNVTIEDILDRITIRTNLYFQRTDNTISVSSTPPASVVQPTQRQSKTVSGIITDDSGEPIIGANIVEEGTTNGTVTNIDGNFSLQVENDAILHISYLGYLAQKINTVGKTTFEITLQEDTKALEELVVLGFTTQKRSNLIGSVAEISNDKIKNPAYSNFTASLQGKASGVFVSGNQIRVRGVNSISLSSEPLWIIDGVTGNGSDLNPNDIESVTILKDAAATALYGSSGANGVIVVTTKASALEKSQFSVEFNSGFERYIGTGYPLMNTEQFLNIHDISLQNASNYSGQAYVPYDPNKAFDWKVLIPPENRITREEAAAIQTNLFEEATDWGKFNQIYFSGVKNFQNQKEKAYFSITYRHDDGQVKGISSNKLIGRFGVNLSPVKNLDVILSSINRLSRGKFSGVTPLNLTRPPIMPLYDEDDKTEYWSPAANELILGDKRFRDNSGSDFWSSNYIKANYQLPFIKGLSLGGQLHVDFGGNTRLDWYSEVLRAQGNSEEISGATESSTFIRSYKYRGEVNYNRVFGDHGIDALVLTEFEENHGNGVTAQGIKLNGSYHKLGVPGEMKSMNSNLYRYTSAFSIGRIAYNYKSKFLFEANIRRDGISRLSKENRYAVFPSFGAGWIISKESFFNFPSVSLFKIRGSFGKTGNSAVPEFTYAPTYSLRQPSNTGYDTYMISKIASLASIIKWETSDNIDLGFDYGLFSNRVNGSFAYYNKRISGLLLKVPIPPSTGMDGGDNSIWNNVGNMENSGIEFDINAFAITNADFSWNISFNFTTNRNRVLALSPTVDVKGEGLYGSSNQTLTKKGEKIATYYLPEFAGIDPDKGIPMIWERDAEVFSTTGATVKTGNKIPATAINAGRNQMLMSGKSANPDFYGGLKNSFTYKNLSIDLMFTFSGGHYLIDQQLRDITTMESGRHNLHVDLLKNSWQKPGDRAEYSEPLYNGGFYYTDNGTPSTIRSNGAVMTSQYLKKADNIQFKEVSVNYSLRSFASKLKMNDIRVYANINNVAYWSKAGKWHNPEVEIGSSNLNGYKRYEQLLSRTYSMGLLINF